jgi:hypothetical protein
MLPRSSVVPDLLFHPAILFSPTCPRILSATSTVSLGDVSRTRSLTIASTQPSSKSLRLPTASNHDTSPIEWASSRLVPLVSKFTRLRCSRTLLLHFALRPPSILSASSFFTDLSTCRSSFSRSLSFPAEDTSWGWLWYGSWFVTVLVVHRAMSGEIGRLRRIDPGKIR